MPEDIAASLMQGLDGGLSIRDILLSQMDTSDPTMAMVARMIAERSAASTELSSPDSGSEEETDEFTQQRLKKLSKALRQLRWDADSLRHEVEELQFRNDTLAGALGACYLCWGEYPLCEVCNGTGSPGHFPINVQAFTEFILPAIRLFKKQKSLIPTPEREVECESIR